MRTWRSTGERISFENNNKNKKTDDDKIDLMEHLYYKRLPAKEIANRVGVPQTTVNNYIKRYFK